ncbi:thermonuclease family protein [Bordetella genomosp. 1]|uniref:Nuclease n=1 Tax=Bordetella genomosp. 1 TaxID=1395607 RepID=A0ABX4EWK2_9BORD|nr:thermonuclease family protein [Bordetella genomosp. 1]OZI57046.1 nuclease [Bordetella genomosp. 1]
MARRRGPAPLPNRLVRRLAPALAALLIAFVGNLVYRGAERGQADAPATSQRGPAAPGGGGAVPGQAVPAGRYTLTGTVVNVADGDTVTLRTAQGQRRVRLDSIDAPETGHGADQPGQPYAEAARKHLAELVAGREITAQCYERDQYDRELCALMLPDGNSANRAMVAAGYAWAYTARRGDYLRDQALPALQRQARDAGRGLWQGKQPTEPWKWRYDCWKQRQC